MPQPISRVKPGSTILIGNIKDRPLRRRPDLAPLVAEAISSWSNVEFFMLTLFIELMGGNSDRAATVYLALEIQSAKTAAINAVAEANLPDHHKTLLRAILAVVKSHQKSRDKIAHWMWGYSLELPDALLLANPKGVLKSINREDVYVYKRRDFEDIIQANERLAEYGAKFGAIISGRSPESDALYAQLCAEPEIRERLNPPA